SGLLPRRCIRAAGSEPTATPSTYRAPRFRNGAEVASAPMSIRTWWEERRRKADAERIKQVEEEAGESAEERALEHQDRWDRGADNRVSGRIGERPDDLNRLGDFNPQTRTRPTCARGG